MSRDKMTAHRDIAAAPGIAGRLARITTPACVPVMRLPPSVRPCAGLRRAALLLILSIAAIPAVARSQPARWPDVIEAYLDGRVDEAARLLASSADTLTVDAQAALDAWTARARLEDDGPAPAAERRAAVRRVQASALLPLEVLVQLSSHVPVGETPGPLEVVATAAWERLSELESLRLDAPGDRDRRSRTEGGLQLKRFRDRWQVAYLQYLVNGGRHRQARALVARLRLPPDDPVMRAEVRLLAGMPDEFAGRMVEESAIKSAVGSTVPVSRVRGIGLRLDEAARAYGQALAAIPSHREARLRLGRVQLERKRPAEAADTLAPLRTTPCRQVICGLAWLFTGEAYETSNRLNDASAAYAQASTALAVRQSALVALMQLSLRGGRPRQAFDLTSQFSAEWPLASLESPDAWSDYLAGRRADADAVLQPLREALLP